MKYIVMTYAQIESMVATADGYDSVMEWRRDTCDYYTSIYDLVEVENMGFARDGGKYYVFERTDGKMAVWFKR